ncbi:hypothetical protein M3Y94_01277400 [Aphelenchoides besseyi]|nr:hypothetical protein M3Y94_01277400 [Aphelenchoides besseyi]
MLKVIILLFSVISVGFACYCVSKSQRTTFNVADIVAIVRVTQRYTVGSEMYYKIRYVDQFKPPRLRTTRGRTVHLPLLPQQIRTPIAFMNCGALDLWPNGEYLIAGTIKNSTIQLDKCSGFPIQETGFPLSSFPRSSVSPQLVALLRSFFLNSQNITVV